MPMDSEREPDTQHKRLGRGMIYLMWALVIGVGLILATADVASAQRGGRVADQSVTRVCPLRKSREAQAVGQLAG